MCQMCVLSVRGRGRENSEQSRASASELETSHAETRVDCASVIPTSGDSADSMRAPLPSIPAAKAGAAGVLGARIDSHANTRSAPVQRGEPSIDRGPQAGPDRMEEQRMGALMEDSMSVGERSGSGHDNMAAQEWSGVSTRGGGVVPSSPPSPPSSGRSSECVEPHGSLSLSFPVGMHPPTPHMGPLGVWGDGR